MKIYTEEQVMQMLEVCRDSDLYEDILTFDDILKTQTPIELPSDEEIEERAERNISPYSFIDGVDWLKDYIKGGNNGNNNSN